MKRWPVDSNFGRESDEQSTQADDTDRSSRVYYSDEFDDRAAEAFLNRRGDPHKDHTEGQRYWEAVQSIRRRARQESDESKSDEEIDTDEHAGDDDSDDHDDADD